LSKLRLKPGGGFKISFLTVFKKLFKKSLLGIDGEFIESIVDSLEDSYLQSYSSSL